jgi:transglutaminase-like putative cysteine protease
MGMNLGLAKVGATGTAPLARRWLERLRARQALLPRDTRDTLFLLAVLGWTVMPHLGRLPLWCSALSLGVLAWRAALALRGAALPSRWTVVVVLCAAAALTWWSNRTLLGKEAGVTLIVVLAALKTLELRARRDTFVVFFLGFFLVLTNFLYSQSLMTALLMVVSVWGLLTALVLAHMPVGQPALGAAARLSMRTALLGAPLMVLLFVLFPRFAPLWGLPADAAARTGLSNSMSLGTIAELAQDDTIALRVEFAGAVPPPQARYFRGPVLTHFDGRQWTLGLPQFGSSNLRFEGQALPYVMTVEPLRVATLPLLEITPEQPRIDGAAEGFAVFRRTDLHWSANQAITERLRVSAVAFTTYRHGPTDSLRSLGEALQLPSGFNPRTLAWAQEFRAEQAAAGRAGDAQSLAQALLRRIRTGSYTYTLAPGTYGPQVVDEFWLDRKEGFCEHFAAAFVVAMRAMGVPARVVTGYLGGEVNPVDGNLEVRNSDAHAWAEFWQRGTGWVRIDPTAAVAPERVVRSLRLEPPQGLVAGAIDAMNPELLKQLRAVWDALDNRWNQWVLNYSRGRQMDLLRTLGMQAPSWEQLAYLLIMVLCTLSLAGAAWAWWDRHRIDPWLRAYRRAARALAQRGLDVPEHLPPRALAQRAGEVFGRGPGAPAPALEAIARDLLALEALRYAPAPPQATRPATLARQLAARVVLAARSLPPLAPRSVPPGPYPAAAKTRPRHA